MLKKLILVDCDGVLVDWNEGFMEFMKHYDFKELQDNSYSMRERYGFNAAQEYNYVDMYCRSEFIAKLKPMKNSLEVVNRLAKRGYEFVAITSIGTDPQTYEHRKHNLETYFPGVFKQIFCIPAGSNKSYILRAFQNMSDIWVEDHVDNAEDGTDLGFNSFLLTHSYNRDSITKANRVDSWRDIERWIIERENTR